MSIANYTSVEYKILANIHLLNTSMITYTSIPTLFLIENPVIGAPCPSLANRADEYCRKLITLFD